MTKVIFSNFVEYWHYAKHFTEEQRTMFFNSMSQDEQDRLKKSYKRGGWDDVFKRDIIDKMIDEFKETYNIDLLDIRYKIMKNKSVYVPKKIWNIIIRELSKYNQDHINYVIGGVKHVTCKENKDVLLLVNKNNNT